MENENTNETVPNNNQVTELEEKYPGIDPVVSRFILNHGGPRERKQGRIIEIRPVSDNNNVRK
jgi:hypothetical protein